MQVSPRFILALTLLLTGGLSAQPPAAKKPKAKAVAAQSAAKPLPPQAPDVAAPKLGGDGKPNAGFIKAHESYVKVAREGKARLVFLGDSITNGWNRQAPIWQAAFGAWQPANFGIGGDRTQHVLWRIENGELEGIRPEAFVVMIGTNNSRDDDAAGIARGITRIVETLRTKQPQAKILLLAVFPRGERAANNAQRDKLIEVNRIISKLHNGESIHFLDIGDKFLQPDGSLTKEIMPDYLHLSAKGYQIWADAITPTLKGWLK